MNKEHSRLSDYLPTKKVTIPLAAALIILLGFKGWQMFGHTWWQKWLDRKNPLNHLTIAQAVVSDRDGDGLPDWEEPLWEMDPNNPDTDDNGIPDGAQVAAMKELLRAQNNNGSLDGSGSDVISANDNSASTNGKPLTKTEDLAQGLFVTVASLSQAGSLDDQGIDKLSTTVTDYIQKVDQEKIYTAKDIATVKNSSENFSNYSQEISRLLVFYSLPQTNPLEVVNSSLAKNDPSILSALTPLIKSYDNFLKIAISISVPQNAIATHLGVLNAVELLREDIVSLSTVNTDPVKSMGALTNYSKHYDDLGTVLNAWQKYFQNMIK